MKLIETKPISMSEAKEAMLKKEKDGELNYEQKLALEHLKNFTKISEKDAKKLEESISAIVKLSPETLVQILNLMPKNPDELRLLFAKEKFSLKEEELKKILELIEKYL
ncbi:MAG: RNA polymerase Rpb4 family protein [Candidatus Aenigmarchaeota archaeon]|nr:RNA polymerase Rpb4 family protein [Candidatus Aenigmarchaeota archaeon]